MRAPNLPASDFTRNSPSHHPPNAATHQETSLPRRHADSLPPAAMFRTAILRVATASRAVARPAVAMRQASLLRAAPPFVPRLRGLVALRMYSAGGGLDKEAVEGRIMSLLQGFDKVCRGLLLLPPFVTAPC